MGTSTKLSATTYFGRLFNVAVLFKSPLPRTTLPDAEELMISSQFQFDHLLIDHLKQVPGLSSKVTGIKHRTRRLRAYR